MNSDNQYAMTEIISGDNGWTARGISEQVEFFHWIDALCMEAARLALEAPWPFSQYMADALNYWFIDFDRGLSPAAALDINRAACRTLKGRIWVQGHPIKTYSEPVKGV